MAVTIRMVCSLTIVKNKPYIIYSLSEIGLYCVPDKSTVLDVVSLLTVSSI